MEKREEKREREGKRRKKTERVDGERRQRESMERGQGLHFIKGLEFFVFENSTENQTTVSKILTSQSAAFWKNK